MESKQKWYKWIYLQNRKETHRLRKQTYGCQVEGTVRDFGKVMCALLYLKWITKKDLLYSIWNSAQCYVAAWMEGGFGGRMEMCVCVWMSPFAVHLKLSQHCELAICQYKMFLVLKKRIKLNFKCIGRKCKNDAYNAWVKGPS